MRGARALGLRLLCAACGWWSARAGEVGVDDWGVEAYLSLPRHQSCRTSVLVPDSGFCSQLEWHAALTFPNLTVHPYRVDYGLPEDVDATVERAGRLGELVSGGKEGLCVDLAESFACMSHLRHCPVMAQRASSLPPCRRLCELVERNCDATYGIFGHCHLLPEDHCSMRVPEGYFLLSEKDEPHAAALAVLFTMLTALWGVGSLLWGALCFALPGLGVPGVSKLMWLLPGSKGVVVLVHTFFWFGCSSTGLCSGWLSVAILNAQLIHETFSILILLLAAKGLSLNASQVSQADWREILLHMVLFYCGASILIILWRNMLSPLGLFVFAMLLYGLPLGSVALSARRSLRYVRYVLSRLPRNAHPFFRRPAEDRAAVFSAFFYASLCLAAATLAEHALLLLGAPVLYPLLVAELAFLLCVALLLYLFRPRAFSPYFFLASLGGAPQGAADTAPDPPMPLVLEAFTDGKPPPQAAPEAAEGPEGAPCGAERAAPPAGPARSLGRLRRLAMPFRGRAAHGVMELVARSGAERTAAEEESEGEAAEAIALPPAEGAAERLLLEPAAMVVEQPDGAQQVMLRVDYA